MRVAVPTGARKARYVKGFDCLSDLIGDIEAKGKSRGLSNRDGPPINATAAPTGIGSGGETGKQRRAFEGFNNTIRPAPATITGGAP